MSWYWYYLIVGVYVATAIYGMSIRYKVKNLDYNRTHPLLTWHIVWQFPFVVIIWWLIVLGLCWDSMRSSHLKQELKTFKENLK